MLTGDETMLIGDKKLTRRIAHVVATDVHKLRAWPETDHARIRSSIELDGRAKGEIDQRLLFDLMGLGRPGCR